MSAGVLVQTVYVSTVFWSKRTKYTTIKPPAAVHISYVTDCQAQIFGPVLFIHSYKKADVIILVLFAQVG